uniref:Bidirectional sugar transporter SWEET n=1 Tax=Gossypium raimondii TaxID=29730 RepID=A0A0D2RJ95_GOSRA|nr:hypothetical protein B456_008G209000 [Gossypium raimondii]
MALHLSWVFVFGILGNAVSFMVSLAPLPTFYQIYKKKTSEGFQSIPYVVSLFSAMLWIYYALLKKDAIFLITINTFCVFIQTFYIVTYFYYGPKKEKRKVIKTKSVEYMPFTLSVFLTLGAVMWFFYGLCLKDMNVAVPNILGFIFGVLQMILYAVYKNHPKKTVEESDPKLQLSDHPVVVVDVAKLGSDVNAVIPNSTKSNNGGRTEGNAFNKV